MTSEIEGDAAALRRAFNRAAEMFPGSVTAFLNDRGASGREQAQLLMAWWAEFYAAIVNTTAGLAVLAEVAQLKETARAT